MPQRVIHLAIQAPKKPAEGAPCNGCGVCCAAEPCPLGVLASRRRRGPCAALVWSPDDERYRCGWLTDPQRWLPLMPAGWTRRLATRWIASGTGCDADLQADRVGG